MTWHVVWTIVDVAMIIAGLCWLASRVLDALQAPRMPAAAPVVARLAPASAHQLGLAHRLAARLVASPARPADEEFAVVAELWPAGRAIPYATPAWDMTLPLLGLEDLLERLEDFNARITKRLGRRRGQS